MRHTPTTRRFRCGLYARILDAGCGGSGDGGRSMMGANIIHGRWEITQAAFCPNRVFPIDPSAKHRTAGGRGVGKC